MSSIFNFNLLDISHLYDQQITVSVLRLTLVMLVYFLSTNGYK